jgi:hypothetical protein
MGIDVSPVNCGCTHSIHVYSLELAITKLTALEQMIKVLRTSKAANRESTVCHDFIVGRSIEQQ